MSSIFSIALSASSAARSSRADKANTGRVCPVLIGRDAEPLVVAPDRAAAANELIFLDHRMNDGGRLSRPLRRSHSGAVRAAGGFFCFPNRQE
jgi:hypothetical protein